MWEGRLEEKGTQLGEAFPEDRLALRGPGVRSLLGSSSALLGVWSQRSVRDPASPRHRAGREAPMRALSLACIYNGQSHGAAPILVGTLDFLLPRVQEHLAAE